MTTGLDQALVEWWRATAALNGLLPVDRVASEVKEVDEQDEDDDDQDGHYDDEVAFQIATAPHWKTNSAQGWKSEVKVSVMSKDYDRSKALATAVASAWNNTTFSGSKSTITLARVSSNGLAVAQDESTGRWDHTVSFTMNHTGI